MDDSYFEEEEKKLMDLMNRRIAITKDLYTLGNQKAENIKVNDEAFSYPLLIKSFFDA